MRSATPTSGGSPAHGHMPHPLIQHIVQQQLTSHFYCAERFSVAAGGWRTGSANDRRPKGKTSRLLD